MNKTFLLLDSKRKKYLLGLFSFLFIYMIAISFFLVNGESVFPGWTNSWSDTTMLYLVLVEGYLIIVLFRRITDEQVDDELIAKPWRILYGFSMGFLMFLILFWLVHDTGFWFQGAHPISGSQVLSLLMFQLVVVVISEEIIFRGALFQWLKHWSITGAYLLSSLLFAFFHWNAYDGNLYATGVAFLLGLVFCWLVDDHRFTIPFLGDYQWEGNLGWPVAAHLTYNGIALGLLLI